MAPPAPATDAVPIQLVVSDVDGTLVTPDKELTPATIEAVHRLRDAGIAFAVTSGRPPRGMDMLIEPLELATPMAAFNGGMFVDERMQVLEQRTIPDEALRPLLGLLGSCGLDTWVYRGSDWLVRDPEAPHVAREAATVRFEPTVVESFDDILEAAEQGGARIAKVVGVGDDHDLVARVEGESRELVGHHVSAARSQPYYLDVTNPAANKGAVVDHLCAVLGIPHDAVCTLGDMPNDVLMFARSGMGIAMGNADPQVQRTARHVTTPNTADGFARAIEHYVLPTVVRPGAAT